MIRLARVGARKQPHYRVVVIEKDRARNGRSVEVVGTYNPRTTPASLDLKRDRIDFWVGNGALLSDRVGKLFAAPLPEGSASPVAAPVAEPVAGPVVGSPAVQVVEAAPAV
jgi:small subunit ribosomal protein S16